MSKRLEISLEHMVSINMSKPIIWKKSLMEPLDFGKKALFIDCILKADAWSTFPRNKWLHWCVLLRVALNLCVLKLSECFSPLQPVILSFTHLINIYWPVTLDQSVVIVRCWALRVRSSWSLHLDERTIKTNEQTFQNPQWMPGITDSIEPFLYHVFTQTFIPITKFNL